MVWSGVAKKFVFRQALYYSHLGTVPKTTSGAKLPNQIWVP